MNMINLDFSNCNYISDIHKELKTNLAAITKENEQLEVNIENSLNLNNLEKEAKERLGMQKLTNKQTVYINLPKKEHVEPATEEVIIEEEPSWFENLINKILRKWKVINTNEYLWLFIF